MIPVTFIITSSNRFDLLQKTLRSFFDTNKYPISKFILNEDSGNWVCTSNILSYFGKQFHVLYHPKREGLSTALDNLYSQVKTEYVFTCEDDWLFYGDGNFIQDSLKILESRKDIHQVWIRDPADHTHPMAFKNTVSGVDAYLISDNYQGIWSGFTWNPGLRRVSDYRKMFPNGYAEFGDEAKCSAHVNKYHNYKAVSLVNHACRHLGFGRHTEGFKV
jgi:hypothetical protein